MNVTVHSTAAPPSAEAPRDRGVIRGATPLGILIFIYILVGVGRVHQYLSFLSPLHPALLTFLLIVGYVVINPAALDVDNILGTWSGKVVLMLGAASILSGVFGISLGAVGVFLLQHFATVLIFACIMVAAVGRFPVLRASMFAFVLSAAFWLYLSYFVLGASTQGAVDGIMRLDYEYTYDANDICVIFAVALPLTLMFHRVLDSKWAGRLMLLCAVGIPGAVALSGSRGGLLGLAATSVALLFLVREVSVGKKVGLVFAAALGLVVMAPDGYWNQMETILEPETDYNWSDPWGRRQIWLRGMGYVLDYPVFGVGADQFPRAEATIGPLAQNHVAGTALRYISPHNTSLQVMTELGIPAFLVWFSVILLGIFWLPRHRRRLSPDSEDPEERFLYHACTYLPAAWSGFLVSSMFVSFAYLVPYFILNAWTAGVVLGLRRQSTAGIRELVPAKVSTRMPEWRSRRVIQQSSQWQPGAPAARSALVPGEGFAPER